MKNRRKKRDCWTLAALPLLICTSSLLLFSCEPGQDARASKDSYFVSYEDDYYLHGEYEFLNANPLSPGFHQMFKLRDFQGKYTFWSVECPL